MVNVRVDENIDINGMSGDDTIVLNQVEALDNVFARMGQGSDTLNIVGLKARRAELYGDGGNGDGYDRLFITQSPQIGSTLRTGFEEINGQRLIKKTTVGVVASR